MIEAASYPADLTSWQPEINPFYLELYGETTPLVDEAYAEVVPAGGTDPRQTADAPVYDYWWTLGHPGSKEPHHHWWSGSEHTASPWRDLEDDVAARVFMYFPISAGWRAKELVATLRYLSPTRQQHEWLKEAAQFVQPLLSDASSLAGLLPDGAAPSKWLQAISKLQCSSLPQSTKLEWSVEKVACGSTSGVMQGVMWSLPRSVFELLGGRITGSLAVSFIPASAQHGAPSSGAPSYGVAPILAQAVVCTKEPHAYWVPEDGGRGPFVHLNVAPRSPVVATGGPPLVH